MPVAGSLSLCSPLVLQVSEINRRSWSSCVMWKRIAAKSSGPPISRRPWQLHSIIRTGRRPAVRAREDPEAPDSENERVRVLELGTSQAVGGREPSWLPVLPHVLTAAMSNFMFGYHIGIINGPLRSIAKDLNFDGDNILQGFVVSIFIVGAFIGSISGGVLSDAIGRRRTFQAFAVPLILGAALSASAESVGAMALGRLLVGIGIGVNTSLGPLYISEIAPTKYRGTMGSLCQIGTCVGIIASLIFGIPAETDPHWWRTMFYVAIIPSALLIVAMELAVESPRWLGKVGRWNDARATFEKLWGKDQVENAVEDLRKANSGDEEEATWAELLSRRYLKVAGIGCGLFALQQFAGINGILYFSSSNFRDAGITNSIEASALVGLSNLTGALIASSLMDSQGRKKLLIGSYTGMALSVAIMVSALNVPMEDHFSHGLTVIGTLLYVFTFALGAGPVTALIVPEMCGTRIRAKALAVSLCVHWVCNFGIGLFFLQLVQQFGLPAVYSCFGTFAVLSIIFTNSFIVETKGRSLEEIELLLSSDGKNL